MSEKTGPKPKYHEPMVDRVSFFAPKTLIAAMTRYGNGNTSAGFRRAAEEAARDEVIFSNELENDTDEESEQATDDIPIYGEPILTNSETGPEWQQYGLQPEA